MMIEKITKRNIQETHEERIGQKHLNNEYHNEYGNNKEIYAHLDDPHYHDHLMAQTDQTFYFVIADCFGALEIY